MSWAAGRMEWCAKQGCTIKVRNLATPFSPRPRTRWSVATSKDLTYMLNNFILGLLLGVVVTHHTLLRLGPQGSLKGSKRKATQQQHKVKWLLLLVHRAT